MNKVDSLCSLVQLKVIYNCPDKKPTTSSTANPTIAATSSTTNKWVPPTQTPPPPPPPTKTPPPPPPPTMTPPPPPPPTKTPPPPPPPTKWVPTTSSTANPTIAAPTTQSSCPWGSFCLKDVGQLHDGQLRYKYQSVALPGRPSQVSFSINDQGILTDDRGQTCYFSASTQLQCNQHPQTDNYKSFSVVNNLLSFSEFFMPKSDV